VEYDRLTGLIVNQSVSDFPVRPEIARWGGNAGRKLVLTFDDGPDPEFTPRILDILKQYKVPAVFFVLGSQANRYPELTRRIVAEGHEIGNHTFTHPNLDRVSDIQMNMEINATQRVIESTTGRATLLFRPPYAEDIEPETADALRTILATSKAGYFTVSTRIDGKDWWLASPQAIVNRVVQGSQEGEGNIILLHDAGGNRDATVQALPALITTLQAENFEFASLATMLGRTRDELMPPVDASINPFLAGDAVAYALVRTLENAVYFAFMAAILLTLARTGFIVLLAVRKKMPRNVAPADLTVCAIVPAYNEEKVICQTVRSLLQSNWKDLAILVVDDGSRDRTYEIVLETFADEPRVRIVKKENGGKSEALNLGISMVDHDVIVAMDADTIFLPDTIPHLVSHFSNPAIGAVAGNAKVGNRINLITRWQALEYIVAQNLDRRAFERLNCITVVPGAVGAWRRQVVQDLGGFHSDTLAEDADLTIRVIRAGHVVVYDERAIALTEAPAEIGSFLKQRFRWTYGMMQTALKHLDALTNSKPNSIGLVALPNILIFQLLLPCIAPIADFLLVMALAGVGLNAYLYPDLPISPGLLHILIFYGIFFALDFAVAAIAFLTERDEQPWLLVLLIPQRFFHRQLLYFVVLKSIVVAIRGRAVGWFKLARMATVKHADVAVRGNIPL
jgi:cellulose synthase/poly-beta-1,6-N-acetylglucosamine synthase-like glycosyltransferase/peptidoglycan/xylan/chitin deacetylase (PgdA/CDA1 family)